VDGPAEIRQFHRAVPAQQQILRLDVPMDHVFRMAIGECVRQLPDILQSQGDPFKKAESETEAAVASSNFFSSRNLANNSPPGANSRIKYTRVVSWKYP
jgi:hypothetical protein